MRLQLAMMVFVAVVTVGASYILLVGLLSFQEYVPAVVRP